MIAVAIAVIAGVVAVTCGIVVDSNHADTLTFLGVMVKTTAAQIFLAGAICTWALFAALWLLSLGVRRSRERGIELRDLRAAQTGRAYRAISAAGLGDADMHMDMDIDSMDAASTDVDSLGADPMGMDPMDAASMGMDPMDAASMGVDGQNVRDSGQGSGRGNVRGSGRNVAGIACLDPESPFNDFDTISTGTDTGTGTQAAFAPESVTPPKELTPPPPKLTLLPTLTPPTLQPPDAERTLRG